MYGMSNTEWKKISNNLETIYNQIKNSRQQKYGDYHKSIFHLHTPQSYDYALYKGIEHDEKALFEICKKRGIFPIDYKISLLDYDEAIYKDLKEQLSFILVANELIENKVELVLVTDHNTIDGIKKLDSVLQELRKYISFTYPSIVSGIEISCADTLHVVGIFDGTSETMAKLQKWIDENIMSAIDGTFETSMKVLETIHNLSGVGYIAHLNTSNIFKSNFLTKTYKDKLFKLPYLNIIGVSDIERIDFIRERLQNYSPNDFDFVIDEDSHSLQDIGKSCFWIKGVKCNFQMVKNAIRDYNISIQFERPSLPQSFIEGVSIESNAASFLRNKDRTMNSFEILFSDSLNCFIGGRGTGKSSILKLINFVLNQECTNEEELEFICKNKRVCILLKHNDSEYMVTFTSPVLEFSDDRILKYFSDAHKDFVPYGKRCSYPFDIQVIKDYALRNYIQVYEISKFSNVLKSRACANKRTLLSTLFKTSYSINELVKNSDSSNIPKYLQDILFTNRQISKPSNLFNVRGKSGLIKKLNEYESIINNREREIQTLLKEFNDSQKNVLRITYRSAHLDENFVSFVEILTDDRYNHNGFFCKYNIRNENLYDYLDNVALRCGHFEVLRRLLDGDYSFLNKIINISEFCDDMNKKMIMDNIIEVNKDNYIDLIKRVSSLLFNGANTTRICKNINQNILKLECFDLQFNLNNKEIIGNDMTPNYRSVSTLSLGQKVVAMFDFVLGYSEFSNDYTPLIVDQPEDNLDNQYIYKNLVQQLRRIKSKRQVIIATHNSTIVTNAKAEQVIVMESDGKSGWINVTGYPNERRMITQIINHLEGGIDSFKHKQFIYNDVISKIINQ